MELCTLIVVAYLVRDLRSRIIIFSLFSFRSGQIPIFKIYTEPLVKGFEGFLRVCL
jgi:hypothetical protein